MISVEDIHLKKKQGQKITVLTAYDYPTAVMENKAGIDIIIVGDSVGTNMLGYSDETKVTMDDMIHHVKAVSRGTTRSFVIGDMPYKSFETKDLALKNARRFIEAGANGVKMEGEKAVLDQIEHVASSGIVVCAHIGYTPQTNGTKASAQGKDFERAIELINVAKKLEHLGASMIVLELIPELLAKEITSILTIPTIGIGAGRFCDGQVQVVLDILGLSERIFRHAKSYDALAEKSKNAILSYIEDVKMGRFPTKENALSLPDTVADRISDWLQSEHLSSALKE